MDGSAEFNLLHVLGGVSLAVATGFLLDYVIRRFVRVSVPVPSATKSKAGESPLA